MPVTGRQRLSRSRCGSLPLFSASVAALDLDSDLGGDRAYRLMINSSVSLFWRSTTLDDTVEWLGARDYQIVRLDASAWMSAPDMHREIASALDYPTYNGRNLDALNDCMRDVVAQEYGWRSDPPDSSWCSPATTPSPVARCPPRTHSSISRRTSHEALSGERGL
jgi:hypothetical protein